MIKALEVLQETQGCLEARDHLERKVPKEMQVLMGLMAKRVPEVTKDQSDCPAFVVHLDLREISALQAFQDFRVHQG